MSVRKECWNICCICWENNTKEDNCIADDLTPNLCKKSNIDLRSLLEHVKNMYAQENNTLPIKCMISELKTARDEIDEKWNKTGSIPGKEIINSVISSLEKR